MTKYSGVFILALIACLLSACSIDLAQPQASPPQPSARPTAAPTLTSPPASKAPALPKTTVPTTWGALKLQGKLVFLTSVQKDNNAVLAIKQLDLASGDLYTLFQGPEMAWIYSVAVAPDASRLVSYQLVYRLAAQAARAQQTGGHYQLEIRLERFSPQGALSSDTVLRSPEMAL